MPKRGLAFVSLCALGWLFEVDASAQDRSVQSFPARTDIITVDVVVLDAAGHPVRGLRQGDFTVVEDGHAQEVVAFEVRDLRASPAPAAGATAAGLPAAGGDTGPNPGRTLALVVDDMGDFQCMSAVDAIRRWIREEADPRDEVSLLTTSGRVQPVKGRIATGRGDLLMALDAIRCRPLLGSESGSTGSSTIVGPDADPKDIASSTRGQEIAAAWRERSRALVGAIDGFAREHTSERGRKPVIVFTEGFIRDDDLKQTEQAIDVARRTNTALYFIDPRGVGTRQFEGGVELAGAAQMAVETGGALVRNNDVAGSLAQAIDESEAYYLLGYVPGRAPDGTWRRLQVKVGRQGVKIRARGGYLASVETVAPRSGTTVPQSPATQPQAQPAPISAPVAQEPTALVGVTAPPGSTRGPAASPIPSRGSSTSSVAVPLFTPVSFRLPGETPPGDVRLDGTAVVNAYRDFIERYRRDDPATSPQGRALVAQAAGWNLGLGRMAATLAAMPPSTASTVVRLRDEANAARAAGNWYVPSPGSSQGARGSSGVSRTDDAMQRELEATRSRPAEEVRTKDAATARGGAPRVRVSATLAATPRPPTGLGSCLIALSSRDCAAALKAAALLHTDVATALLLRGDHEPAATHRAIAGWLLWHLPQDAQDDAFVRDWLLAVNVLLLRDGSLSSARELGQMGLARFPNDAALLLSTARATEALATLCYAPDGRSVGEDDCNDAPAGFDRAQPGRLLQGDGLPLKQGDVVRETERLLRAVAKALPADPEVHLRLGRALAQRGQTEEAERELRGVVTSSRDTNQVALAHLLLGRLAETRSDAPGALEHARAARDLAPRSQAAQMALASALLASGDRRGAAEVMADLPTTRRGVEDLWGEFLQGSTMLFGPARAALYARVTLQ